MKQATTPRPTAAEPAQDPEPAAEPESGRRRRKGVTQPKKSLARGAAELIAIVAIALGLALAIQAFLVKPYEIPKRLDAAHPAHQPARAGGSGRQQLHLAQDRRHPRVPPSGQRVVRQPATRVRTPTASSGRAPVTRSQSKESTQTFIKRVVGLPGDRLSIVNGHVIRNGVRESRQLRHALRRRRGVQLPGHHPGTGGRLLHDGRQSARLARQPILGPDAQVVDHRRGVLHLLATGSHRPPLA